MRPFGLFRRLLGQRALPRAVPLSLALLVAASASVTLSSVQEPEESQDAEPTVVEDSTAAPGDPFAQPIDFSHQIHVAERGIDCQMCHVYARRSPVAGIPSVQRCAQCHEQVLSEEPEVQRILEFWENEQPIPWVRVHDLPDHVRFSHKRHVLGGVDCAECHGDVSQMEAAVQVETLSMGWCLNCHIEREASRDCLICHY